MVRIHLGPFPFLIVQFRGISSAGRAAALQAVGQRFDPAILHSCSDLDRRAGGPEDFDNLAFAFSTG